MFHFSLVSWVLKAVANLANLHLQFVVDLNCCALQQDELSDWKCAVGKESLTDTFSSGGATLSPGTQCLQKTSKRHQCFSSSTTARWIYIHAFGRQFHLKTLTLHSKSISSCICWDSYPWPPNPFRSKTGHPRPTVWARGTLLINEMIPEVLSVKKL